jgi:mannosyltransferase OCH1-like enzyme
MDLEINNTENLDKLEINNKEEYEIRDKDIVNDLDNSLIERYENIKDKLKYFMDIKKIIMKEDKIPLNIFQTWHTKELPEYMRLNISRIRLVNPEFRYFLYDDNDCREFIKENYSEDVLNAFDNLIPGAYKADLWRYCILYKKGGVYMDIKLRTVNKFKLIHIINKNQYVFDHPGDINSGIWNAFIVSEPNNEIMKKCIDQIVIHVRDKYYGENPLYPTGPQLLKRFLKIRDKLRINLRLDYNNSTIKLNKIITIIETYEEYRKESSENKKIEHYNDLWHKREIYK